MAGTRSRQASDVGSILQSYIDRNDMLLVVALAGEAAWTGLIVSNDRFIQSD
jgi:hypothetical protein